MQRHLQCAKQQASAANLTKYCPCHARWLSWLIFVTYETSFTMRGRTDLILQHHQMLRLPRKMTRIIYPRDIWNVIYNARRDRSHPPTSPNAAPATQNDSHHLSSWHMKRHFQCAEQQASPSNLTKYCACHEKWCASLIVVAYETSFTMRGATGITIQPHQILRLPRKSALQNLSESLRERLKRQFQCAADSTMIRAWSEHDPTMKLQNWTRPFAELTFPPSATHFVLKITTFRAPAIYPDFTEYCACHENWHSKITKYCACRAKWLSWLMSVTHDTSFTMRGATDLILQHHQMLRLPRKMTRIIYPRDIWNVIYNARSNKHHTPTSPNAAPATKNDAHHWSSSHMKRYLQCAEQQASPSNLTKYCACHEKWCASLIVVAYETLFTMRGATDITLQPHQILRLPRKITLQNQRKICRKQLKRQFQCGDDSNMIRPWSEHDPNMIRPWTRHLAPARSPRLLFALRRRILYWKLQHFARRLSTQISPNTAPATKSDTPTSPNTAPATKSATPRWRNTAPATKSDTPRSPNTAPATKSDTDLWLYWAVTELSCYWAVTELLLSCYWTVTELLLDCHSTVTELTCYWAVTKLSCYSTATGLLLNCYWTDLLPSCYWTVTDTELSCYWAVTLLSCYLTELLLHWAVTWLSCYFTELLLYWTVPLLSCYLTALFLYWAVTLLSCYFTELLLYWAVTWLSCYFTELLLDWAVTLLLLYWAVTLLSCYFTELLLHF